MNRKNIMPVTRPITPENKKIVEDIEQSVAKHKEIQAELKLVYPVIAKLDKEGRVLIFDAVDRGWHDGITPLMTLVEKYGKKVTDSAKLNYILEQFKANVGKQQALFVQLAEIEEHLTSVLFNHSGSRDSELLEAHSAWVGAIAEALSPYTEKEQEAQQIARLLPISTRIHQRVGGWRRIGVGNVTYLASSFARELQNPIPRLS
jgi:hypothetical protein